MYSSISPFFISSSTIIGWEIGNEETELYISVSFPTRYHTSSDMVTTPYNFTTLGCRNWPIIAASFRNLVLIASFLPALHTFTATSIGATNCCVHTARLTVPNCPLPINFTILIRRDQIKTRLRW